MYRFKEGVSKNEIELFNTIFDSIPDLWSDFYTVKESIRIPFRENRHIFYSLLRHGDKVVYDEDGKGLALITGWATKSSRKYVKVLSRDDKVVNKLLKLIYWNIHNTDLYIQVKKNNRFIKTYQHNNFYLYKDLGDELILMKRATQYRYEDMLKLKGIESHVSDRNHS